MTILLGILSFLLNAWPFILGGLALIFHNWTTAKLLTPLLNNFWGQAFVMLAIVILVFNIYYFIKSMIKNTWERNKK